MSVLMQADSTLLSQSPTNSGYENASPLTHFNIVDSSLFNRKLLQTQKLIAAYPDSSLRLLRLALLQSGQGRYPSGYVATLVILSDFNKNRGRYADAITALKEAIVHCETYKVSSLATIYYRMASVSHMTSDYEQSAGYCYTAMQHHPDEELKVEIYNTLAATLIYLNQPDKAFKSLDSAEYIARKGKHYRLLGNVFINKSQCLSMLQQWNKSNSCLDSARRIGETYQIPLTEYAALVNLGYNHILTGMPGKAIPYLEKAQQVKMPGNPFYKEPARRMLGQAYYMLGDYDKSSSYLLSVLKETQAHGPVKEEMEAHKSLVQLYSKTGKFNEALKHQILFTSLKDSIENEKVRTNINQLDIRYRTAEKDKHITSQQLLIAKQEYNLDKKNSWIMAVSGGALLLGALAIFLYRNYKHKQRLQSIQIRFLQQEQEILNQQRNIDDLKATVAGEEKERERIARDLHDGIMVQFSTIKMNLSVLPNQHSSLLTDQEFTKLMVQLDNATSELRKTAHNLMPDTLLEKGLADAVNYFCTNLNLGHTLKISYMQLGTFPALKPEFQLMIYRIIQELVQNVIKHANATKALVQLSCVNNLLSITIEDNGKGMNQAAQNKDNGMGLKGIQKRIAGLGGDMDISSDTNSGVSINIELDISQFIIPKTEVYAY